MDISKEEKKLSEYSRYFAKTQGFNVFLGRYRIKKILEHCKNNETLLDAGCSYGKIAKSLSPFFKKIVAVDGSKKLIELARKQYSAPNIFYHVSLIESFNTKEKFDVILMSFILEHVADPVEVLKRIRRFLKKNGTVFVMVPNARSLHRRVGKAMGMIDNLYAFSNSDIQNGHRRVYDLEKIIKDVEMAGLEVVAKGTFFVKPLSNSQMEQIDTKICDALYEVSNDLKDDIGAELYVTCKKKQ